MCAYLPPQPTVHSSLWWCSVSSSALQLLFFFFFLLGDGESKSWKILEHPLVTDSFHISCPSTSLTSPPHSSAHTSLVPLSSSRVWQTPPTLFLPCTCVDKLLPASANPSPTPSYLPHHKCQNLPKGPEPNHSLMDNSNLGTVKALFPFPHWHLDKVREHSRRNAHTGRSHYVINTVQKALEIEKLTHTLSQLCLWLKRKKRHHSWTEPVILDTELWIIISDADGRSGDAAPPPLCWFNWNKFNSVVSAFILIPLLFSLSMSHSCVQNQKLSAMKTFL